MAHEPRFKRGSAEWYEHLRNAGRKGGTNNVLNHPEGHMTKLAKRAGDKLLRERCVAYFREIGSMKKGEGRPVTGGDAGAKA